MPDTGLVSPAENSADMTQGQASAQPQTDGSDPQDAAQEAVSLPPALTRLPAIQGVLVGAPPAVSASIKEFKDTDAGKAIVANKDALLAAGFGFYRSMHGGLAVLYNRFHIHGEDLKHADKQGKLTVLAPPFEQVDHALAKNGGAHLKAAALKGLPTGFAQPTPQAAPQQGAAVEAGQMPPPESGGASPASQALQKRLLQARVKNQQPGAPTSGPAPGGGRLLNTILKQVV